MQSSGAVTTLVAPLSSQSLSLQKATVTQAIRPVVLCKDKDGKFGLRLHSINSGLFVCYVAANSPAALGGLRFGDQILEINGRACAGMTMDQAHSLLNSLPVNGVAVSVRDRYNSNFKLFIQNCIFWMYMNVYLMPQCQIWSVSSFDCGLMTAL